MFKVIKNDFRRSISEKNYLIIVLAVTMATIMLAVYFTAKSEIKGNIAIVSDNSKFSINSKYIKTYLMKAAPEKYELIMGKYDAVIIDNGDGTFKINTYKGKEFRDMLENGIKNPSYFSIKSKTERAVGANILGYLTMFILMEGTMFMKLFSEDKVIRVFKRVMASPISLKSYIAGHCIFNFLMMYVPTFLVLIVEKELFKVDIGFSYMQYSYLLFIVTMLSTAFAYFMSVVIENSDDSMMMSSFIIVISSILSGCFYSLNSKNDIVSKIMTLMPQKNYISLVQGIESNKSLINYPVELCYLFLIAAIFFILGTIICRKLLREGQ